MSLDPITREWRDLILSELRSTGVQSAADLLVQIWTNDTYFLEVLTDEDKETETAIYGYPEIRGRAPELWPLMLPQITPGYERQVFDILRGHGWAIHMPVEA